MIRSPLSAVEEQTASGFLSSIPGLTVDDAAVVYVVDDDCRFVGALSLAELLRAAPHRTLGELADRSWPRAGCETDREDAATLAITAGRGNVAVFDASGRLVGAVDGRTLCRILRDEHLEDLHHMSGILGRTEQARAALGGSAFKRAQYRLPWLLLGLAGSAIATMLMAGYEATLTRNLAIAYFVPAVVYLADAVGTQAEAIAVRSLSLTSSGLSGLMVAELLTGCTIGAVLGLIALPLVWFGFGALDLAVAVAITLVGASTLATTLGFMLPWIFSRLGFDPALGSGPIATVIQDIASLGINLAVVELVVA